jgi:hypothetical protein
MRDDEKDTNVPALTSPRRAVTVTIDESCAKLLRCRVEWICQQEEMKGSFAALRLRFGFFTLFL